MNKENYRFFLSKYLLHVHPVAETLSYCLMPNHFHFICRMRDMPAVSDVWFEKQRVPASQKGILEGDAVYLFLSKQLSNFQNSYTKAFNKVYKRRGNLFMRPSKQKRVGGERYLRSLIKYVHLNPVNACICRLPEEWMHSSYRHFISEAGESPIISQAVLEEYFDDVENFIAFHQVGTGF